MSASADPKPVAAGYPAGTGAGVAYPYPAPPPAGVQYYPAIPPSRRNTILLRRFLAGAIALFLLAGGAIIILWLFLRPTLPVFSLSSFDFSPPSRFDLAISVRNPNSKISVQFDQLAAVILRGRDTIAEVSLPSFHQGKLRTTVFRVRLTSERDDAAKGIAEKRRRGGGEVGFQFRMLGMVRFRAGFWGTGKHGIRVYCDNVSVRFKNATSASGWMIGPPKRCQRCPEVPASC